MNSKSKIWQIVLLALLVLAIAVILFFNNKLNASKETLSTTMAQLTEEQQNAASLQADLDATKADYEQVSEQLTQEKARTVQLDIEVADGNDAGQVSAAVKLAKSCRGGEKPTMVILNTVKGCGVKWIEELGSGNHNCNISAEQAEAAIREIRGED